MFLKSDFRILDSLDSGCEELISSLESVHSSLEALWLRLDPLDYGSEMNNSGLGSVDLKIKIRFSEAAWRNLLDETEHPMDNDAASRMGTFDSSPAGSQSGQVENRFIDNREGTEASGSKDASVPPFSLSGETADRAAPAAGEARAIFYADMPKLYTVHQR